MHAKEALTALKLDRKRLKAEKFDLLNQMKQLYGTLEDKEKELRDFIRNYEQVYNISKENPFPPPFRYNSWNKVVSRKYYWHIFFEESLFSK